MGYKQKKPRQLSLLKKELRIFGGQLLHGRRRGRRPFNPKEALHLVMRSSWAMGPHSFLRPRNYKEIQRLIKATARKYEVKVYQHAVVGNHLHLVIRAPSRELYKAFIRVLSGKIASHIMKFQSFKVFKALVISELSQSQTAGDGPQKHRSKLETQGKDQQFWQFRPWTRLLLWGKDFKTCCEYVVQNTLEAMGFVEYKPRRNQSFFTISKQGFASPHRVLNSSTG